MLGVLTRLRSQIQEPIADLGVLNGSLYLIGRLLTRVSADKCGLLKYYFVAQPIKGTQPPLLGGKTDVTVQQIYPGAPWMAQFPRPDFVLKDRYAQGAVCFAATKGEALIGFIWIVLDQYVEDEVRCVYRMFPEKKAAWDFDVYIDPRYRLGRTFIRLWDAAAIYLTKRHYQVSISRISAFNQQSLRSHARMGAVRLGSAVFIRLGIVQIMFSGLRPYLHVSVSRLGRPTFDLVAPTNFLQN